MTIRIPDLRLAIYTSPKVLSTSLKYWAFEQENSRTFEPFVAQGATHHIHRFYPTKPFQAPDREVFSTVVAFVRDPVERLVSVYQNRVMRRHRQSAHQWDSAEASGLRVWPDFEYFVLNLEDYMAGIQEIRHHAADQVDFLGDDLTLYDHVFTPDGLDEFRQLVVRLFGVTTSLPHHQRSSVSSAPTISERIRSEIAKHYHRDYEAFGRYFAHAGWKKPV